MIVHQVFYKVGSRSGWVEIPADPLICEKCILLLALDKLTKVATRDITKLKVELKLMK